MKHLAITIFVLGLSAVLFGLYHGASFSYGEDARMMDWDHDGPYVFQQGNTLSVEYIRGNHHQGFYTDKQLFSADSAVAAYCYFPLDSTRFGFPILPGTKKPAHTYTAASKIFALSDIESSFRAFRDLLLNNGVIDQELRWTFGTGHLVLAGDFIDRDFSATQVLWLIYKLEQEAAKQGGQVHYILGNHELKNMQGNYESTSPKYFHVSAILGKQQQALYDTNAVLGKWMASKNAVEMINGILFTHGGIHPDIAQRGLSLEDINKITAQHYYIPFYPQAGKSNAQLVTSTKTGVSWYRGYFKDNPNQRDIDRILNHFKATHIVVGHTLQSSIRRLYNGKVIGIDVKHPKDYNKNFPAKTSEGLLIEGNKFYRCSDSGSKVEI
ncbi:metallophosphoesterase [Paraflavitalea pollutisoli]|uniref:metallophosphoesterase n=1 Tax=Paraflavitalea pollutisoli TaxID=3034143 RepID=UPI0023EE044E|nr:metallophosphoesterase [Paraflavitalea sp. H1-2-19X]